MGPLLDTKKSVCHAPLGMDSAKHSVSVRRMGSTPPLNVFCPCVFSPKMILPFLNSDFFILLLLVRPRAVTKEVNLYPISYQEKPVGLQDGKDVGTWGVP